MRFSRLASVAVVSLALGAGSVRADLSPDGVFREVAESAIPGSGAKELTPVKYRTFSVDVAALERRLASAPLDGTGEARTSPLLLSLPHPDGSFRRFYVFESPVMAPELQSKYPEVRTYTGQGLDDPTATVKLDLTPQGFHALVLSEAGTVCVDPYRRGERGHVLVYWKRDYRRAAPTRFVCDFDKENPGAGSARETAADSGPRPAAPSGATLRTYRLAVAATGEYTVFHGGTVPLALAAIVTSVNRVNGVYERDVAIRMTLIANNNLIVYTNGATDPYTNGSGSTMLGQNQTNLDTVIGSANYDIGHVFSTGGGGVATLNGPCGSSKARGVTGSGSPVGDAFDIDYVAHEMGHQWGARHTFNGTSGSCSGSNRTASAAYEPGSGATIMAYAGICPGQDLQPNSDDYFHVKSFDEIVAFSTTGGGNGCAVPTATGNNPPTVSAGASYTIPQGTPFTLTASGSDPNGHALTYCWEEYDLGPAQNPTAAPRDNGSAPIFRSYDPVSSPSRTFPTLTYVLSNANVPPATYGCAVGTCATGEFLPATNRTMTYRVTARDNQAGGGGVDYAWTTVTATTSAGPFQVTAPNTALTWTGGTSPTVTWDVAGTTAAPVSCANVELSLSTDGGATFPTVLLASTPNDGTEPVLAPSISTTTARVRAACVGNVFFDVSDASFTITPATAPAPTVASVSPTQGPLGGGTSVTVTGTNFVNGATVRFGATASGSVTFGGSTSLTAVAPAAGAPGTVSVTVTNPDLQAGTLPAAYTYLPLGATGFSTVAPCRAVDTREPDGPLAGPALQPGAARAFAVSGVCGIPADAIALSANVTVTAASAEGFLRLYATGTVEPDVSTINFRPAQTRANNAIVPLNGSPSGSVTVRSGLAGTTHFILDVNGYFR